MMCNIQNNYRDINDDDMVYKTFLYHDFMIIQNGS